MKFTAPSLTIECNLLIEIFFDLPLQEKNNILPSFVVSNAEIYFSQPDWIFLDIFVCSTRMSIVSANKWK